MNTATLIAPLLLASFLPSIVLAQNGRGLDSILKCETGVVNGLPAGWEGRPVETVALDTTIVRSGRSALRIQRIAGSAGEFTALSVPVSMDFAGDSLELRGYLRTEAVSGFAGLWVREDGRSGVVEFANMEDRGVTGTTSWSEYSITLPANPAGRTVNVGVLLVGSGTLWADDLQLLVDGTPIDDVPRTGFAPTVFDTDTEFDNGSGITNRSLSVRQADDLAILAKVWGFVKYHHPKVATGNLHWDYELFRVMPAVLSAANPEQRNRAMVAWLDRIGAPDTCTVCASLAPVVHLAPPIDWIRDTAVLGRDLSERLTWIYENRFAGGEQFYVSLAPIVGNPVFQNELEYRQPDLPDPGYRLLALMRLWNIVEYWFPYRDQVGESWDDVLREFIPRLAGATTADAYRLELMALLALIHDTHANLWSGLDVRPPRGAGYWPIALRYAEGRFVVAEYLNDTLGSASGLQIGDAIIAIDGRTVDSLVRTWLPLYAASNDAARMRDIARSLPRGARGRSTLTIEREGKRLEIVVTRDSIALRPRFAHDRPGDAFQMLSPDIAYLKLSNVRAADVPSYLERASTARGLVIDIRNYPSEFVVFALGSRLMDAVTTFARFTKGDPSNPGAFVLSDSASIEPAPPHYRGRIAILVDEMSQSQAEYTALAFRKAPGAVVIGSTTAGADGNVSSIPLPGGQRGMISGIGVFYPDGTRTQRVGIIPDIVVLPTIAGIRAGRDEVLEVAVRRLEEK